MKALILRAVLCLLLPVAIGCAFLARLRTETKYLPSRLRADLGAEMADFRKFWREGAA